MTIPDLTKGDFTLPGEAGYEALTLRLARRWGADTIRDSDGTQLSPKITRASYRIYSTLCLVRSVNAWAKRNPDKLQQNFLMSFPVVAERGAVTVELLRGYFREQFVVNFKDDPKQWWQVFDRTTGREVPKRQWSGNARRGTVPPGGGSIFLGGALADRLPRQTCFLAKIGGCEIRGSERKCRSRPKDHFLTITTGHQSPVNNSRSKAIKSTIERNASNYEWRGNGCS